MLSLLQDIGNIHHLKVLRTETVTGGDINLCFKLYTTSGIFFIKLNEAEAYPAMMQTEALGLQLLASTQTFRIPAVIDFGIHENWQYLLLEWIEKGTSAAGFAMEFGKHLAALHRNTQETFGLSFNNFIGRLPQQNDPGLSFPDFYAELRILPLVSILRDKGHVTSSDNAVFENLCVRLADLIPTEPPALIHGDLWAGNYLTDSGGVPVLIDPAPYFGHRESDIAMMKLFGGFPPAIFAEYQNNYPLETGWETRIPLFQLYPLLVHAVLFGGSYITQSISVAKSYT